jgi:hypothetical protein
VCANSNGTEKRKLFVTGKSKSPWCFKNVNACQSGTAPIQNRGWPPISLKVSCNFGTSNCDCRIGKFCCLQTTVRHIPSLITCKTLNWCSSPQTPQASYKLWTMEWLEVWNIISVNQYCWEWLNVLTRSKSTQ